MGRVSLSLAVARDTDDFDRNAGQTLRNAREARQLTQKQLGAVLGVGQSQVANYESGYSAIPLEVAMKIHLVLGVDLYDLVGLPNPASQRKSAK